MWRHGKGGRWEGGGYRIGDDGLVCCVDAMHQAWCRWMRATCWVTKGGKRNVPRLDAIPSVAADVAAVFLRYSLGPRGCTGTVNLVPRRGQHT